MSLSFQKVEKAVRTEDVCDTNHGMCTWKGRPKFPKETGGIGGQRIFGDQPGDSTLKIARILRRVLVI